VRVVIDILHPAHVHVFRHFMSEMEKRGHDVLVYSRHKDVTVDLLDAFGIHHETLSTQRAGVVALAGEMALRCTRLANRLLNTSPDVFIGIMGPAIAVTGKLFPKAKTYVFYDNESARSVNKVVYRLADYYCTPEAYQESAGPNHVRYPGYHELAYLHPNWFTPDRSVVERYGLGDEPLFLLRFVAWESIHDVGESGLSLDLKRELIRKLSARGRVAISSESELPAEFESYRLGIQPEDIHHILAHASLLIGESSTMASEAAVLGCHAFFVSKTGRGVNDEQEAKYGINHCFTIGEDDRVLARLDELLALPDMRADAEQRRDKIVADSVDLTRWMIELVEQGQPPVS
jgi:hypothetical protein